MELIDPDTGVVLSRVYPLDKQANASGLRRARGPAHELIDTTSEPNTLAVAPSCVVDEQGLSPLMRMHVRDYVATGLPTWVHSLSGGDTDSPR